MKNNILTLAVVGAIAFTGVEAFASSNQSDNVSIELIDHKTETFRVYGNCGMCEKTIEGSLTDVKGIESADWDKETKMIVVIFDEEVISLDDIKKRIAKVGYDTEEFRSSNKNYNSLPGCCQYERPEAKKSGENHENHKH